MTIIILLVVLTFDGIVGWLSCSVAGEKNEIFFAHFAYFRVKIFRFCSDSSFARARVHGNRGCRDFPNTTKVWGGVEGSKNTKATFFVRTLSMGLDTLLALIRK